MPGQPAWRNWARSVSFEPAAIIRPSTGEQIVSAVARASQRGQRVRVVGRGHSFSSLTSTDGVLLDITALRGCVATDQEFGRATFRAGTTMAEVNRTLAAHGLALRAMGTSRASTLAGSVVTGTHGCFTPQATMAGQVDSFRLVTAGGEVIDCRADSDPEMFEIGRVSLGTLGVVSEITLNCVPEFDLHVVRSRCSVEQLSTDPSAILTCHTYATAWWRPGTDRAVFQSAEPRVVVRHPTRLGDVIREDLIANVVLRRAAIAGRRVHAALAPRLVNLIETVAPSHAATMPSSSALTVAQRVPFVAMEYAIPIAHLSAALRLLRVALDADAPGMAWPVEIRFSKLDTIPMSLAHGRDTAFLNIVVDRRFASRSSVLKNAERVLVELDGRPHLAKAHSMTAVETMRRHAGAARLNALRRRVDPTDMFGNDYLDSVLLQPKPDRATPPSGERHV